MTRYNHMQCTTFGYTGWVPVPLKGRDPYEFSPFYGQIFAADALGHYPEVRVYEIPHLSWDVSTYSIYGSSTLSKYVA
ncbi:hypothetical protein DL769_005519 [Monosporascus sp. CRB-8-3]|nr:hypothetical protein DL769_005519 [Monosporascus sp. CRB-8-3]